MLGMIAMHIGIFGGAFDPVTTGHIAVCNYLIERKIVDKVYLLPCNKSYYEKKMAAPSDRIKMCELAVGENKNIEVCDYEIANGLEGETLEILEKFLDVKKGGGDTFAFIIGMDNGIKIETWTDWKKLVSLLPFIVVPRVGSELVSDVWFTKAPHVYVKDFEANIMSSTQVRLDIKSKGESSMVDKSVVCYIKANGLYQG
ncbi:MAG: hypothetical protein Hyperionvirus26_30 [Hyperionvirus sp.]|uniref:Cytidyltransferase-like domain-containing protein n=1 Tax=Hyperionvirus sp. TaxID=2487770 RepID=A0A3G5AB63_9VIRU|nr:MAG: hypothetical protein Hyperionvirus26_30 [Hyperionvirus sp.]